MDKTYNHKEWEDQIYKKWEESGAFEPESNEKGKPFTIIMPPPNANDPMHVGHVLGVAIQDILIRYHRMRGDKTLWLPGTDHAGIETQYVYEKKLNKEGKSRFDFDRETLYQKIWDYVQENSGVSVSQMKKMGASADWDRFKFTLDKDIVNEVVKTFRKLHDDGFVYRGERLVNYCTKCGTGYSELEVEYEERVDPLFYVRYRLEERAKSKEQKNVNERADLSTPTTSRGSPLTGENDSDDKKYIVVATTRPEPIFADTHLAVNPTDGKNNWLIGKKVLNPLTDKEMEIIGDEMVDPEFGTGIVKLTPAHDAADWAVAEKFGLPIIKAIGTDGKIVTAGGELAGMKVTEARKRAVEILLEKNLIEKIEEKYVHRIGTCYRCHSVIEPLPLPQFFIKTKEMAEKALKALDTKETVILGNGREKILRDWLVNLRDWNISRQVVWGIRMPVWYEIQIQNENVKSQNSKEQKYDILEIPRDSSTSARFAESRRVGMTNTQVIPHLMRDLGSEIEAVNNQVHEDLSTPTKGRGSPLTGENNLMEVGFLNKDGKFVKGSVYELLENHSFEEIEKGLQIIRAGKETPYIVSETKPGENYLQETDSFDTWFSSGQWPAVTLKTGKENDFENFYPTDVLDTAYEILPFWVMRMMLLGIYMTGKSPFKNVYLHGLIRDEKGLKMSKSKGNTIDPLILVEKYGADAIRFALVMSSTPGNDSNVGENKVKGMRNLANKIWNAGRFVKMLRDGELPHETKESPTLDDEFEKRLKRVIDVTTEHLDKLRIGQAAEYVYGEFWHWFCDECIENGKKGDLSIEKVEKGMETFLKLLHPFAPFVTEAVWESLGKDGLLMREMWS